MNIRHLSTRDLLQAHTRLSDGIGIGAEPAIARISSPTMRAHASLVPARDAEIALRLLGRLGGGHGGFTSPDAAASPSLSG